MLSEGNNSNKISLILNYKAQTVQVDLRQQQTVKEIKKIIKDRYSIPQDQQMLTFEIEGSKKTLDDEHLPIKFSQLSPYQKIFVKNIGKQIKWNYVFYLEYLGPILIIPAFYFFGKRQKYSLVQPVAATMGVLHYVKRQLQTAFVHVFSRNTMPFKRVFINSAHYWILFGLLNSIELFLFPREMKWDTNDVMILFIIWAFMEFCNFKCHQELSSFRKKNAKGVEGQGYINRQKTRGIPKTWGFKYVSCANYLWETLGWLVFSLLTKCYTSFLFTAVSAGQMADWALKKHKAYKKQFGDKYPKNRKAFIPFIL